MVSPDSDQRFHPNPELLTPINDDFSGKDILSTSQLNRESFEMLFGVSELMERDLTADSTKALLTGISTAAIFVDTSASFRTRGSFVSAISHLGGLSPLTEPYPHLFPKTDDPAFDFKILAYKATCTDGLIIMRHSQEGAVKKASEVLREVYPEVIVPIINAGDGIGEHPTQAMLDMYTLKKRFGKLNNLTGVIAGDLKNGRTLHSLIRGLSCYTNNSIYLLSPESLQLRDEDREYFSSLPINIVEIKNQDEIPLDASFWYWTRVQKERFENPDGYEAVKDSMVLTNELLKRKGNKDMVIMHPGPVISEVARPEIDPDPRWIYFEQAKNGLPVRMALLALVLGKV